MISHDVRTVRVGVVGLGVGEQHVMGYLRHPSCEVVALCDTDQGKRDMALQTYPGIRVVERADEILTDPSIDAVSIATYDDVHFEQVMMALEHHKHVFVEKPLCLYEEHAREIRSALKERPNLVLSSNLILRKSPRFQLIKKKYEEGVFGNMFYVEGDYQYGKIQKLTHGWRGTIDFYSVMYGGGVHVIDLLMWILGERVTEVVAYGNQIATRGTAYRYPDFMVSLLKFESGVLGKVSANFACVFPHFHSVTLYGTQATFVNGKEEGLLYTSRDSQAIPESISAAYPGVSKGDLIASFIEAILCGGVPEVTEDDVFAAMSVCFAIEKAQKRGGPVKVDYL